MTYFKALWRYLPVDYNKPTTVLSQSAGLLEYYSAVIHSVRLNSNPWILLPAG
jgi:hypothetical protein